jgi:hypothetical protein
VALAASFHYLIHWPTHGGYNFISGPLADVTLITAFAGTLYLFLRRSTSAAAGGWLGIPIPSTVIPCAGNITQKGVA